MLAATEVHDPSWQLVLVDITEGALCLTLVAVCLLVATALLVYLSRFCGNPEDEESTLLLLHGTKKDVVKPWLAMLLLLGIGFSPLGCCVMIGGSLDNVLAAMFAMHWLFMLLLPLLYYVFLARVGGGAQVLAPTAAFYKGVFNQERKSLLLRLGRGTLLGLPACLGIVATYSLARCRTLRWGLCVEDLREPMESYGFAKHSMTFRVMGALYFTFWNPFVEELFWRVFLYRELGLSLGGCFPGQIADAAVDQDLPVNPWWQLWEDLLGLAKLPMNSIVQLQRDCTASLPRTLVCALYASYHMWPISVLFGSLWWIYGMGGFVFLACLGRFFLLLRESPGFGIAAAYSVHLWVDAAFAIMCLRDPALSIARR
mmetsp:Transcript_70553/g.132001  ORF Transcript_70553/g.132001 Transcript_70553/m.132001 type:complete len:371 (+) Transcript_70553:118-1230(+)